MVTNLMITELTPEQEALIPVYREKWMNIALSTESIDRKKVTQVVKRAYALISLSEPEIIFCDSPYAADRKWNELARQQKENEKLSTQVSRQLENELYKKLVTPVFDEVTTSIEYKLYNLLWNELITPLHSQLIYVMSEFGCCIQPEEWAGAGSYIDFCFSVLNLNCTHELDKWSVLQSLVKYCGRIYLYEEIAFVCVSEAPLKEVRPRKLSFDRKNRLYAEGEPAISFADGFSVYAYHGVTLPKKYGIHPNEWKAEWLIAEDNVELRRILIEGIGYERCQELQAQEIDNY